MKILLLNPFRGETFELENCSKLARADAQLVFEQADDYPLNHVYYQYYQFKSANGAVNRIVRAESEGYDAVVICCMADNGLWEARQLVDIPVVGIWEASAHLACTLGHKFSIIAISRDLIPMHELLAKKYGVASKLASIRHIDIPAWKLYPGETDAADVVERTLAVGQKCVDEDGAEVLVMGGSLSAAIFTKAGGGSAGLDGVPIIDPVIAGYKTAEMMVDLHKSGLPAISRIGFWKSPPKAELNTLTTYFAKERNNSVS